MKRRVDLGPEINAVFNALDQAEQALVEARHHLSRVYSEIARQTAKARKPRKRGRK